MDFLLAMMRIDGRKQEDGNRVITGSMIVPSGKLWTLFAQEKYKPSFYVKLVYIFYSACSQ